MHSLPEADERPVASAHRLVREIEAYLHENGIRPVHVSEICEQFRVSRRSLHRAFDEVLGMGPVTFLRHKRLCTIHSILRDSVPSSTTVGRVALQHGILELGRFSRYYHSMFGEYPSDTLRAACRANNGSMTSIRIGA